MSREGHREATKLPFGKGLFVKEDGKAFLIGSRCNQCGQLFFPSRKKCLDCESESLDEVKFGRKATLYSYAISHMPSTNFEPLYAAGWIDVEEKIRIFSPLRLQEGYPLEIGMKLKLEIDELWRKDGNSVMGYIYTPK